GTTGSRSTARSRASGWLCREIAPPRMTAGLALAALLAVPASPARPSVREVFDTLEKVRNFHDVAISKDGGSVAWSEKAKDARGSERLGRVFVASPAGAKPRRLTGGTDGKD